MPEARDRWVPCARSIAGAAAEVPCVCGGICNVSEWSRNFFFRGQTITSLDDRGVYSNNGISRFDAFTPIFSASQERLSDLEGLNFRFCKDDGGS